MSDPLVLLSGAGLPAWIWDPVVEGADDALVPTYPRRADARLEEYAAHVLEQVPWPRFVLVAHSLGGVVARSVVAAAPERVSGLLAVSAVVPAAGSSFVGSLPAPQRWLLPVVLRLAGTRPPERQIRRGVGAALPGATADRLVEEFATESRHVFVDRVPEATLPAHRGYVHTTADRELPSAVQRRAAATLGGAFRRELATGHLPMLEAPDELRAAIGAFRLAAPTLPRPSA